MNQHFPTYQSRKTSGVVFHILIFMRNVLADGYIIVCTFLSPYFHSFILRHAQYLHPEKRIFAKAASGISNLALKFTNVLEKSVPKFSMLKQHSQRKKYLTFFYQVKNKYKKTLFRQWPSVCSSLS